MLSVNEPDERDAQGWETAEGDGVVPSQAEIRYECAFTYMNAVFRKNLTLAMAVDANDEDATLDTGGASGGVNRHRAVSPDNRDIHIGRERPPAGRAWGEEGGRQTGVAHAPL